LISKLEICTCCDASTGNAGKGEGSLYWYNDGPYCEHCYDNITENNPVGVLNHPPSNIGETIYIDKE